MMAVFEHTDIHAGNKMIKSAYVVCAKAAASIIRMIYRAMLFAPQEKRITFMSRQTFRPLDFVLLETVLKKRFPRYEISWACVNKSGNLTVSILLKQIAMVATSELVITDGYIPAVSICSGLHRAKCIQIWHALGAIKKFGKQSLDTPAGRDRKISETLKMHEGYDRLIGGFPGAKSAFSDAFGYSQSCIDAIGLPRVQYLVNRKETICGNTLVTDRYLPSILKYILKLRSQGKKAIIYAPTFRKDPSITDQWMTFEVNKLASFIDFDKSVLVVSGHPFQGSEDDHVDKSGVIYLKNVKTLDILCAADVIITDYSAIAFEAYISKVPVVFYVPDIERYRQSPGLNIDPLIEFPDAASEEAHQVIKLADEITRNCSTTTNSFETFMEAYVGDVNSDSTFVICKKVEELLGNERHDECR